MSAHNLRYIAILIAVTLISFIAIKLVSKPPGDPLSGNVTQALRPTPADAWIPPASAGEPVPATTREKKPAAIAENRGHPPNLPLSE